MFVIKYHGKVTLCNFNYGDPLLTWSCFAVVEYMCFVSIYLHIKIV